MNSNIFNVKQEVLMAVVQYCANCNPELAKMLDNGIMPIRVFIDEVVMEFIRYAYDVNGDKFSIRKHLNDNGMKDNDSQKAAYGRIKKYSQKYRDYEADYMIERGFDDPLLQQLRAKPMNTIDDKKEGYEINTMQFFELTTLRDVRILKSFVEHRLEDVGKVKNEVFIEMFDEYDEFIDSLRITDELSNEKVVFNSIAYWVLEWKYPLELFYSLAKYMEENKIDVIGKDIGCRMAGYCSLYRPDGVASTHSRFIKIRNGFVSKIVGGASQDEIDFDTFTLDEYLAMKARLMKNYCDVNTGESLRDQFAKETTIDDWADFLREYDVFSSIEKKEWTNERIRIIRGLIKQLTIKY